MTDYTPILLVGIFGFGYIGFMIYRLFKMTELNVWIKYKITGKLDLPERKDAFSNRGWLNEQQNLREVKK